MAGSDRLAEERDVEEADSWTALRETGDPEARRRLIERHTGLVRRVAAQLYARRPDEVADFEDYLHYGMVGLLEAVGRYDADRGASFATYATYRIRGAILNGLEKTSEQRAFQSYRSRMRAERVRSLRTDATEATDESFREMVDVTIGLTLGVLLEMAAEGGEEDQAERSSPYASYALARARAEVRDAVASLPEREAIIVRYHYFHHMSFSDIGGLLGITKGRVSQLHGRALQKIRELCAERRSLDGYY